MAGVKLNLIMKSVKFTRIVNFLENVVNHVSNMKETTKTLLMHSGCHISHDTCCVFRVIFEHKKFEVHSRSSLHCDIRQFLWPQRWSKGTSMDERKETCTSTRIIVLFVRNRPLFSRAKQFPFPAARKRTGGEQGGE